MVGASGPGRAGMTRRGVLQGAGLTAFGIGSVAALKLPFFSVDPAKVESGACIGEDLSATQKEVIISNWPGYIDPRKKATSTVSVFQDRTGITVDYTDDVNDNNEFYAKVKNQLGSCEPINRDMMMLTDWMAAKMIGLGWIQPLDKAKVPEPPRQPDRAAAQPPVGPRPRVPRAVAERADRHRLQRGRDR